MGKKVGKHGFLLIELIVAIAVLAVMAGPVFGLFVTSLQNGTLAEMQTVAANLAREKMEEVKSRGYCCAESCVEENVSGFSQFFRSVEVYLPDVPPGVELKEIVVTVSWCWQGSLAEVTLVSYLARR